MRAPKTEEKFQSYLSGYERMTPEDLLHVRKGGMLRYAIDWIEDGIVKHKYGAGILATVDPFLGYLRVIPWKNKVFCVKLDDPTRNVRLYYLERKSKAEEEIAVFRKLLEKLENGEIEIVTKK